GTVNLSGGNATYLDQRGGKSDEASQNEMTVSMPSPSGPVNINGSATWDGEKGTNEGAGTSPRGLLKHGADAARLTLASAPLKLSFQGELSGRRPHRATGSLDLSTPVAGQFLAWLGLHRAPAGGVLGPLSIKGWIDAAGSQLSLANAEIVLG